MRKKQKDTIIIGLCILLLFMLGVSQCLSLGIANLIITAAILCLTIFARIDTAFVILFMCLPFFNMLNFKLGSTSLYYLIIGVFIIKYVISNNFTISRKKLVIFLLVVVLRLFIEDFELLLKWTLLVLPFILTLDDELYPRNAGRLLRAMSVSMFISSGFGYYMLKHGLSIYTRSYVYMPGQSTIRLAGLIGDSVVYGQFLSVLIAMNLAAAYLSDKWKAERLLFSVGMAYFAILTYAKSSILLVGVMFLIYLAAVVRRNAKNKKTLHISLLLLIITIAGAYVSVLYITNHMGNPIIQNYTVRFTSGDLLTGRSAVFTHYVKLLSSDWLHIFIPMKQSIYEARYYWSNSAFVTRAHNIYIETICAFGLIGTLCIFGWIIKRIWKAVKNRCNLTSFLPMIVLLAGGVVLHGHYEYQYYFTVALAMAYMSKDMEAAFRGENKEV